MTRRRTNLPVQLSFAVIAIAFTCFVITIQTDQYFAFAQEQSEQNENHWVPVSGSNIGEIQLHPITFWDKLKIATLAYIDPLAPVDKSVIYIYEFKDQAAAEEVLSQIQKKFSENLMNNWYVGPLAMEPGAPESLIWRPTKLNKFNLETEGDGGGISVATNLRMPSIRRTDIYWVLNDEWILFVEKER